MVACVTRRSTHAACVILLAIGGCSGDPETSVVVPPPDAGTTEAGADAAPDVAEDGPADAPEEVTDGPQDAPSSVVHVALVPTPVTTTDGAVAPGARTDAVLTSLAAGARALVLDESWSELQTEGETDELRGVGAYLRDERARLMLSVPVVDASTDGRPAALQGHPWTGADTRSAMRSMVDQVFDTFGEELAYLSFGIEVDRYLVAHSSQAGALTSFTIETLDYARAHPKRPPSTRLGVTWSPAAWTDPSFDTSTRDAILEASDATMLAFYGVNEQDDGASPWDALASLATLVQQVEGPVVLHRVAYATSPLLGRSEEDQATFVTGLLEFVNERRERIPLVGLASLHDPAPESCFAFAQARDVSSSALPYAFWCSTGLREQDGNPKAGFEAFLVGASRLMGP